MKYQNSFVALAIICTLLTIKTVMFYSIPNRLQVFPADFPCDIYEYTDEEGPNHVGNSAVLDFSVDSVVHLSTVINDAIPYPYAGFRIQPPDTAPFIDIRGYDRVDIAIDSTNSHFFIIDLTTYVEGDTHFTDYMSFQHHTEDIFVSSGKQVIRTPMSKITTQNWWYELRDLERDEVHESDFSRCHTVSFEINRVRAKSDSLFMTVSSIVFVDTKREWAVASLLLAALSILLWGVIFVRRRRGSVNFKPIHGRSVELTNSEDEEITRLVECIAEMYPDPDLNISMVSRQCGVGVDKIPTLLKKRYDMQYKQYLNTVRITEAQRLLRESDRQVSEIAAAIGYNYPTTFNRIFKEITGKSPGHYRKELLNTQKS